MTDMTEEEARKEAKEIWNKALGYRQGGKEKPYMLIAEALLAAESRGRERGLEEFLNELYSDICPYCADKKFRYPELHDGRYHTKRGVSPSWENVRCKAEGIRDMVNAIRARKGER